MDFKYIIVLVIGVVMLGVILEFTAQTHELQANSESLVSCTKNTNCALAYDLVQSGTLVVGNGTGTKTLTETTEYVVDYTHGLVNITNMTATGTFNFSYNYATHNYLTSASQRNVALVVGIAAVIGLLWMIFVPLMRKK